MLFQTRCKCRQSVLENILILFYFFLARKRKMKNATFRFLFSRAISGPLVNFTFTPNLKISVPKYSYVHSVHCSASYICTIAFHSIQPFVFPPLGSHFASFRAERLPFFLRDRRKNCFLQERILMSYNGDMRMHV